MAKKLPVKANEQITDALTRHRGDLFLAAKEVGMTPLQLDCEIRKSEELQAFITNIITIKVDDAYEQLSERQFEQMLQQMQRAYKVEAMQKIYELATMDHGESAALADVKLKAAIQIRDSGGSSVSRSENSAIFEELNKLYHQSAPRIKSIRVAQIEFKEQ